jgi:cobalamin biosynthesis Mg chelatase CobN
MFGVANKKRTRSKSKSTSKANSSSATVEQSGASSPSESQEAPAAVSIASAVNQELAPVRRLPIPFWISLIVLIGFLSFLGSICYRITY